MERGVEDREVGRGVGERQAVEGGLDRHDAVDGVAAVRAEAVPVVGQQIDGGDMVPALCQPVREPAVARAEVEDHQRAAMRPFKRRDDAVEQERVAVGAALPDGGVRVVGRHGGQGTEVAAIVVPPTLGLADGGIFAREGGDARRILRGEVAPDAVFAGIGGVAGRAVRQGRGRAREIAPAGGAGPAERGDCGGGRGGRGH